MNNRRGCRRRRRVNTCFLVLAAGLICFVPHPTRADARADRAVIIAATKRFIPLNSAPGLGPIRVHVLEVWSGYAAVSVTPVRPVADTAGLILRKQGKQWVVIIGPGTSFEVAEFKEHRVPPRLWRHFSHDGDRPPPIPAKSTGGAKRQ